MGKLLLRILINALAIAIVALLLPGIHVIDNDLGTLALIGIIFGIVNAIVKPIVIILSCPLIILTLGLMIPVINALMLLLTASIAGDRLTVDGFWWALLGGIIMGLVVLVLESALGVRDDDDEKRRREE